MALAALVASLLLAAPIPAAVLASTASSALNWASAPNDLIMNGVDGTFTEPTSKFSIAASSRLKS